MLLDDKLHAVDPTTAADTTIVIAEYRQPYDFFKPMPPRLQRPSRLCLCTLRPLYRHLEASSSNYSRPLSSHVLRNTKPFRLAVVGSGPAGFYAAYKVMTRLENAIVDIYEQLPVPFGLVRHGVAPDHPEVKNCEEKFAEVASSPRVNFIGNIDVGNDIGLAQVRSAYDAILFAYGASKDRKLGIPGEDLGNIHSARAFVGWYNGLPEFANLKPDLSSGDEAVVIGQGNVALDVARILLSPLEKLRTTDITGAALEALSKSRIDKVRVIGRRGPMQASFTIKEVRELMQLSDVAFHRIEPDLLPDTSFKLPRTQKRMTQLLSSPPAPGFGRKSWALDFMLAPTKFEGSKSISSIEFARTTFTTDDHFARNAKVAPTPERVSFDASIAFRSIGYKAEAIKGMEDLGIIFDDGAGIIPNDGLGRVVSDQSPLPGLYCTGWVKSGPNGVIANTMEDAFTTADTIVEDFSFLGGQREPRPGWNSLKDIAEAKNLTTVSWQDWLKIDAAERSRGEAVGREREKFQDISKMLEVIKS